MLPIGTIHPQHYNADWSASGTERHSDAEDSSPILILDISTTHNLKAQYLPNTTRQALIL